jgi:hypothetical protein
MNPVGSKCQGKRSAGEEAEPQREVDQEKIWKHREIRRSVFPGFRYYSSPPAASFMMMSILSRMSFA